MSRSNGGTRTYKRHKQYGSNSAHGGGGGVRFSVLKRLIAAAAVVAVLAAGAWAQQKEVYTYKGGFHGGVTYNNVSGRRAQIEVYAVGGGGGSQGQSQHIICYFIGLCTNDIGVGGSGGGGAAGYMKFEVTGQTALDINVGTGGSAGDIETRVYDYRSGKAGNSGGNTSVSWNGKTLTVGGGKGGGYKRGSGNWEDVGGGDGGTLISYPSGVDWTYANGKKGGNGTKKTEKVLAGGSSGVITIGSVNPFTKDTNYGNGGGTDKRTYFTSSAGKDGQVIVVVTPLNNTPPPAKTAEYIITFDAKGGAVDPVSVFTTNSKLSSLPTPTRSGYDFAGWYYYTCGSCSLLEDLKQQVVAKDTKITTSTTFIGNTTLEARWAKVATLKKSASVPTVAEIAPAPVSAVLSAEVTVGPSPVARSSARAGIFAAGGKVESASLSIYDADGNSVVKNISVNDNGETEGRRQIGMWNLKDSKGRAVSAGTYLLRGAVTMTGGKREKVSVVISVR